MSRYYSSKKDIVEECFDVDVFWLKKHGYFCGHKSGGITWYSGSKKRSSISFSVQTNSETKYIEFRYTSADSKTGQNVHYNYKTPIVTTICRYGGNRYWFKCSLGNGKVSCGRRVAKLYLPPGAKYFGCRHCYDLTYDARQSHNIRFDIIGKMFAYEKKTEKLYEKVRRKYYKGKPTKKYTKFLKYCYWINHQAPMLIEGMNRLLNGK